MRYPDKVSGDCRLRGAPSRMQDSKSHRLLYDAPEKACASSRSDHKATAKRLAKRLAKSSRCKYATTGAWPEEWQTIRAEVNADHNVPTHNRTGGQCIAGERAERAGDLEACSLCMPKRSPYEHVAGALHRASYRDFSCDSHNLKIVCRFVNRTKVKLKAGKFA